MTLKLKKETKVMLDTLGRVRKVSAHVTRTAVSAEWDHPQIGSWENSPLGIRHAKMFIRRPRRTYATFKV